MTSAELIALLSHPASVGGEIEIPAGYYELDDTLRLQADNTVIRAVGGPVLIVPSAAYVDAADKFLVEIIGHNVTLVRVRIQSRVTGVVYSFSPGGGLRFGGYRAFGSYPNGTVSSGIVLQDCGVSWFQTGVQFGNSNVEPNSPGVNASEITVDGFVSQGCDQAFYVKGQNTLNMKFEGLRLTNCGAGVVSNNASSVHVLHGSFTDVGWSGRGRWGTTPQTRGAVVVVENGNGTFTLDDIRREGCVGPAFRTTPQTSSAVLRASGVESTGDMVPEQMDRYAFVGGFNCLFTIDSCQLYDTLLAHWTMGPTGEPHNRLGSLNATGCVSWVPSANEGHDIRVVGTPSGWTPNRIGGAVCSRFGTPHRYAPNNLGPTAAAPFDPESLTGLVFLFGRLVGRAHTTSAATILAANTDAVGAVTNLTPAGSTTLTQADNAKRVTLIDDSLGSRLRGASGASLGFSGNPLLGATSVYMACRVKVNSGVGIFSNWYGNAEHLDSSGTTYMALGSDVYRSFSNGGAFGASTGATLEIAATPSYFKAWLNGTIMVDAGSNTPPTYTGSPPFMSSSVGSPGGGDVDVWGYVLCRDTIPDDTTRGHIRTWLSALTAAY